MIVGDIAGLHAIPSTGARIAIRGLFATMPVRASSTSRLWSKAIHDAASRIESLACARPHCSFGFYSMGSPRPLLFVPSTGSPISTARSILGESATQFMRCVRADYRTAIDLSSSSSAAQLNGSGSLRQQNRPVLQLGGLLGLGASTRQSQLLYVNGRHCRGAGVGRLLAAAQAQAQHYLMPPSDDGMLRTSRVTL